MKGILKSAGYILMLILVYMACQYLFTCLASLFVAVYGVIVDDLSFEILKEAGVSGVYAVSTIGGLGVWATAIGLMLSTVAMMLFIHFINGYRLNRNVFRSISRESLKVSTMLVFCSMFAMNIFVQWLGLEDNTADVFDGLTHNIIGVITISLLAPILEELLFRGAIQGYLMRRYKPWIAIVCAALVFGVIHMNPVQMAYATLIGIVFGWIYYRTGSLLSVVVGHVLNNSVATAVMLLFGNEEELNIAGDVVSHAAETTTEVSTFLFFAVLSLYYAIKLNRIQPSVASPWRDTAGAVE